MLKNKTKFIAFFLILILLFSATSVLANNETNDEGIMPISEDFSTEEISEDSTTTDIQPQEDTYKKSDVYLIGDEITIDYIVDGNLFVCANTVTINSQIGGDAFILAENLIIEEEGSIFSNLFTISNNVDIKGVVYDVYALSQNFTISKGYIYRDIKVACDTLNINGAVGRNAFVDCNNIYFNTTEDSTGIIYGDLNYSSSTEISLPENVVNGKVNYSAPEVELEKSIGAVIADYILDLGQFLAFLLITWLLCLWLAPKFLNNTNSYIGKKTLNILGYGALALFAIPIACFILILLQLTGGFSFFLLAIYVLAIIITKSLFTITANNFICYKLKINKFIGKFLMLVASGTVIWVLTNLPYVGWIISLAITVLGLGILVDLIIPKKDKKTIIEE